MYGGVDLQDEHLNPDLYSDKPKKTGVLSKMIMKLFGISTQRGADIVMGVIILICCAFIVSSFFLGRDSVQVVERDYSKVQQFLP